ncbi:MAG: hypothetical protein JW827_06130 [Spirochaetes bacterium]|nr:hypothetical protein [Spirochaetota bacterium]
MKFNKKTIIIACLIFVLIGLFFILSFEEEEQIKPYPLKDDYSLAEILYRVYNNYKKIANINMQFSWIWLQPISENRALRLDFQNGSLYHLPYHDRLKIKKGDMEISQNTNLGLVGYFKNNRDKSTYNVLVNWYMMVYDRIILFPFNLKIIQEAYIGDIKYKRLEKKGYYLLETFLKKESLYVNFTVNMNYGTVEEINIVQDPIGKRGEKNPYMINAKLGHIGISRNVFFPRYIQFSFSSPRVHYAFYTKIQNMRFNDVIEAEKWEYSYDGTGWSQDPSWIDKNELILLKGSGKKIKDLTGATKIIDKSYYLVKRDIQKKETTLIKKLIFSKDVRYNTKFILTADYNRVHGLLAYSLVPAWENSYPEIDKVAGVFIMDMRSKKTIKVSDKGFLPSWSEKGEYLIYNEMDLQSYSYINHIYMCDKEGKNKRWLIKNGFHQIWGKNDESIIFERGPWTIFRGYPDSAFKNGGGIYRYSLKSGQIETLSEIGFNPHLDRAKQQLVFTIIKDGNSVVLLNLNTMERAEVLILNEVKNIIVDVYPDFDVQNLYFIKSWGVEFNKMGMYRYSLEDEIFEIVSNEMASPDIFNTFLDFNTRRGFSLYKSYKYTDGTHCDWGVINLKNKKVQW